MEEVRSYWQVASISHFCTIFQKPFKLPLFEPEELEQAFILEIPPPKAPTTTTSSNNNNHHSSNNNNSNSNSNIDNNGIDSPSQREINHHHQDDSDDPEWEAPPEVTKDVQVQAQIQQQHQAEQEQQELHLLVKLAIALLKPHFNSKISENNWELYLRRIVDDNWVELEHHPSPFRVPLISQDGVELTKNLVFNELPLSDKIDLFYALCDYRLWCDDAADALKDFSMEELRLESIGKDSQGYEYWYFSGTRLFRENKELSLDIIARKKRIKELEYSLIELEKTRIFREQEERRKAELERAKQLAAEAREARLAIKKQQEQEANKKRKQSAPNLPSRTGLRERRSSATGNNNDSQKSSKTPTTRSKLAKQQQQYQQHPEDQQQSSQKPTRSSSKNSKHNDQQKDQSLTPDEESRKNPEEACREELERLKITLEDRAEAWCIQCESLEDWESFATRFEKTKSTNEKNLSSWINQELLPHIRGIYAKRAADIRRKEKELILSLASRRVSTRIITKKVQEEEEERQAKIRESELRQKKVEAEHRLRAELEREVRARMNRFVVNGGASSTCSEDGDDQHSTRYRLRQHQQLNNSDEFDGIIHPDKLSEFYEALELVIDTVRTSKHAWPFVDPVPDTVPGYYDLIKMPMDLRKLRTKIEFREYKSLIELEKDFQLLVNNCEKFNGPRNVYTKMVYKLWKSFRKNVRLYLQRDLAMDEYETFVYPPPPKVEEIPPRPKREAEQLNEDEEEATNQDIVRGNNHNHEVEERSSPILKEEDEVVGEEITTTQDKETKQEEIGASQLKEEPASQMEVCKTVSNVDNETMKPEEEEEEEEPKAPTPEPITMDEEIIIDSYDVPCPDETFFLLPQDTRPL